MPDKSNAPLKVLRIANVDVHIIDVTLRSTTLDRDVTVRLITPPGWDPAAERRWPSLYLLHGGDDGPACWTEQTDVAERAAADGVLVVMPDGGRAGFFTDWRAADRHGTVPRWETCYADELPELIETRFGGSSQRAVAGVSMGGYAAVTWAARRPGSYTAAASYSGLLHVTRPGVGLLLHGYLLSVGERMTRMWGARWRHRRHWADNDPCRLAAGLAGTPVFLAAGNGVRPPGQPREPFERIYEKLIGPLSLDLARAMRRHGLPVEVHYGDGTHSWPSWRLAVAASWPHLISGLFGTKHNKCDVSHNRNLLHP